MTNIEGEKMPESGKSRSGKARMAGISAEDRKALAQKAAASRWELEANSPPKRAVCGSTEQPLNLGGIPIQCYVLEDETRIITLESMKVALDLSVPGGPAGPRFAEFLALWAANHASVNEIATRLESPIRFQISTSRKVQNGYPSSLLVDICEAILETRTQGLLPERFIPLAMRAELLVRGFARVGLDALIDEATGYQNFRSRDALLTLLSKYISSRLLEWTKTFPDEFYTEMFRLKRWDFANLKPGDSKPSVVGRYTKNIVYERMPVPVIHQLEALNPLVAPGRRKNKHHMYMTREIGHPELRAHIEKVVMLMKLSEDWEDFRSKLRKVMPKRWEQFQLADILPEPADAPPTYSEDGLD